MTELEIYDMIIKAQNNLVEDWGDDGKKVIVLCHQSERFCGNTKMFLSHCTCCGGDWGAMFLTGVRELYPDVWEAIPDDMGWRAFILIINVLQLLGVETWD